MTRSITYYEAMQNEPDSVDLCDDCNELCDEYSEVVFVHNTRCHAYVCESCLQKGLFDNKYYEVL